MLILTKFVIGEDNADFIISMRNFCNRWDVSSDDSFCILLFGYFKVLYHNMLKKGMIYMDINLEAICGDAIIELKKIESNSVDLIVTDPPYNLNKHYGNNYDKFEFDEYLNFSREWIKEL